MPLKWFAKHKKSLGLASISLVAAFVFASVRSQSTKMEPNIPRPVIQEAVVEPAEIKPEPREPTNPWSEDEVQAIAQTLAGECYDEMVQDKRLVCEVILNRVSDERFEDTVIGVLTTPHAFVGYWEQSRAISENDLEIAEQALRVWHGNGCQPLSEYRFFSATGGRENYFY